MSDAALETSQGPIASTVKDWSSDMTTFKGVPWGKAMMWIFLLSDTFIFTCFLIGYMTVRMTVSEPWPNPSLVFSLAFMGVPVPLLLIAIMTFILITSSGTMAMAVNMGYRHRKVAVFWLMFATAMLGASFVGMQAFEWSKLIGDEHIAALGESHGGGAVRLRVLHGHGVPRHARLGRCALSADRCVSSPSWEVRRKRV